MAISEHDRPERHTRLEAMLGPDAAATLMEHLPPTTWGDVATRRDLDVLEQRLKADVRSEIDAAISSQTRTIMFAVLASNVSIAALSLVR